MNKLDTGRVGIKPPEVPSKWDIIPIHTSDRGTFKACRRRWAWSSPSRLNLIPKVQVHGVTIPLWFGTGIHYALEKYYNPSLREDPETVWAAWYDLQWNGGLVHESELREYVHRNPQPHKTIENTYVVAGLKDILPDPDYDLFEAHRQLGMGMMRFYKDYAAKEDNFSVVMVESEFSIPITHPDTGVVLKWMDNRTTPVEQREVHARGRRDLIVQDNETGQYGILDNKTAGRIDEDYFRHLDLDDQVSTYWWSAEREAEEYDLEYKKIDFFIYNALRKAVPKPPTMLKNGKPSIKRQEESTTAELFAEFIKRENLQIVFDADEKLQSYYSYLVEMGDKLFIQRDVVRRNAHEIRNTGARIYYEAVDMLNNPVIYHNPTKDYSCLNCQFRQPCKAVEANYDFEGMLDDGYESNTDR